MSESNPFETARSGTAAPSDSALYTATVYLSQTRPWLLFLGIMGLLGSVLLIVMGAFVAIMMGMTSSNELGALGMMGPALGLVYAVLGAIYAVPAVLMVQQAMAIGAVANGGGFDAVNEVLRHNRNLFRVIGGFTLVIMVLYCGGIGLAMVVGVGAANSF